MQINFHYPFYTLHRLNVSSWGRNSDANFSGNETKKKSLGIPFFLLAVKYGA